MKSFIIYTDLDGTLLHPRTYSFLAARPALKAAAARGVPVVFCSSKTRSEIELWRRRCGNADPFIYENGGGILIPRTAAGFRAAGDGRGGDRLIALGTPYRDLRRVFVALREELGVPARGFGDLSLEQLCALTGLPEEDAVLARQREFDEPFFFAPKEGGVERFCRAIEERGLRWTRGGRFYHLHGDNDKGRAVKILQDLYEAASPGRISIGLGDSLNDLPMLEAVDRPLLIQREDGGYEEGIALARLERAAGVGPEGWKNAVMGILSA